MCPSPENVVHAMCVPAAMDYPHKESLQAMNCEMNCESLFLSLCYRKCFQCASSCPLSCHLKFSVVSIIFLPLLAPYKVSVVLAQIPLFWYCIKRLISSVTTGCLMLFHTSSALRKTNYLQCSWKFLQIILRVFTHLHKNNPTKHCRIKGSKSGSTWISFRKVKKYTDSLNKITAAKSQWQTLNVNIAKPWRNCNLIMFNYLPLEEKISATQHCKCNCLNKAFLFLWKCQNVNYKFIGLWWQTDLSMLNHSR